MTKRTTVASLWALLMVFGACSDRLTVIGSMRIDSGAGAALDVPWGTFAAQLPVGPCPAGEALVVNTVADELEGGEALSSKAAAGAELSFAEALWLAQNTPGPHTILFDAAVFPVEARNTIVVGGAFALPQSLENTCIDARDRGVVVYWALAARDVAFVYGLGPGSLQIGLELRAIEDGQAINQAQVAGCRYFGEEGDYETSFSTHTRLNGGTFGPGNVIVAPPAGVNGWGVIRGNFIGFDPRTGQNVPVAFGLVLIGGTSLVFDNVISAIFAGANFIYDDGVFRDNVIGYRPDTLADLVAPIDGVKITDPFRNVTVGTGNRIRANFSGVNVSASSYANVTVTRTLLTAPQPIDYRSWARLPVSAPEIVSAGQDTVAGTCSVEGLIEVFAGTSTAMNAFVGEASCGPTRTWTLVASVASTSVLATLTDARGVTSPFSSPFVVP